MTNQLHDIVPKKEKAAYFTANISQQLIQGVVGTFLLLFYVDVAGLSPAAVGTLFLVSRLFDAIGDPLSGYIIDHLPKSKWGRFRHWLLIGGIVTAINFWLICGLQSSPNFLEKGIRCAQQLCRPIRISL